MPFSPFRSAPLLSVMLLVGIGSSACQTSPSRVEEPPPAAVDVVEKAPEPALPLPSPAPKPASAPKPKKVVPKPKPKAAVDGGAAVAPTSSDPKAPAAGAPLAAKPKTKSPATAKPGDKPAVATGAGDPKLPPATGTETSRPKLPSVSVVISRNPGYSPGTTPPDVATKTVKAPVNPAATAAAVAPAPQLKPVLPITAVPLTVIASTELLAARPAMAVAVETPVPTPDEKPAEKVKEPPAVVAATATAEALSSRAPEPAAVSDLPKPVPRPAKKPVPRRPPTVDPLATPNITDADRRALAAIPLPRLPTLAPRTTAPPPPAAEIPAAVQATVAPPVANNPAPEDGQALLKRASERAGLGDTELARIANAEAMLVNGEREAAIEALALLNVDLDRSVRVYAVVSGENLRAIAARPENYGNAALWPLIWRANLEALPEPWAVQRDQKLIVPSFPPLDDVAAALRYAQEHQQDVVRPESR